ncbi:MAG TPA: hypothetical protein VH592_15510 [Gemmataceae bacterium]|jgi:hypothetical protein
MDDFSRNADSPKETDVVLPIMLKYTNAHDRADLPATDNPLLSFPSIHRPRSPPVQHWTISPEQHRRRGIWGAVFARPGGYMNGRCFCMALVFVLSVLLAFTFGLMKSSSAAPALSENGLFDEKIAMVTLWDGRKEIKVSLEKQYVRQIGDHYFLEGWAGDNGDPYNCVKGHQVWLPINSITQITEVKNIDDLKRVMNPTQSSAPPPGLMTMFRFSRNWILPALGRACHW